MYGGGRFDFKKEFKFRLSSKKSERRVGASRQYQRCYDREKKGRTTAGRSAERPTHKAL